MNLMQHFAFHSPAALLVVRLLLCGAFLVLLGLGNAQAAPQNSAGELRDNVSDMAAELRELARKHDVVERLTRGLRALDGSDPLSAVTILDRTGKFLTIAGELDKNSSRSCRRLILDYDKIPQKLIDALVAVEDHTFWEHHGFTLSGIGNAVFGMRGGSTITMQLIKNKAFPEWYAEEHDEKNKAWWYKPARKLSELVFAPAAEMFMSKEEIMYTYSNLIHMGGDICGMQLASMAYLGKELDDTLEWEEAALLAAIVNNPSRAYRAFTQTSNISGQGWNDIEDALSWQCQDKKTHKKVRENIRSGIACPGNIRSGTQLEKFAIQYWGAGIIRDAVRRLREKGLNTLSINELQVLAELERAWDTAWLVLRQRIVLDKLAKAGKITEIEAKNRKRIAAKNKEDKDKGWRFTPPNSHENEALVQLVLAELRQAGYSDEELAKGRIKVISTVAKEQQQAAREALERGVQCVVGRQKKAPPDAALVSLHPESGIILSMVSLPASANNSVYTRNVILQNRRSPASTFKPIVFAAALQNGKPAESNIDIGSREISMRDALVHSDSPAAKKLAIEIGPKPAKIIQRTAKNFGLRGPFDQDAQHLALGADGTKVSLLELTAAYTTFVSSGKKTLGQRVPKPTAVWKVKMRNPQGRQHCGSKKRNIKPDKDGFCVWTPSRPVHVMAPQHAAWLGQTLSAVAQEGTAKSSLARLVPQQMGKTGTTALPKNHGTANAWFVGSGEIKPAEPKRFGNPKLSVGVWVGYAENESYDMGCEEGGGTTAAPIWADFFLGETGGTCTIVKKSPKCNK